MTDAEKAALAWLDEAFTGRGAPDCEDNRHKATLKAMLAEPRLSKEPSEAMRRAMRAAFDHTYTNQPFIEAIYYALYAHLTKPKTKTVEVWRVECVLINGTPFTEEPFQSQWEATERAVVVLRNGQRCVSVTGPHRQEVPA